MAASSADKKPIMDVSKPGETSAAPTTRPIIAGHRTIMKDPMVSNDVSAPDIEPPKPAEPESAPSTRAKVIQPPVSVEPAKQEEAKPEEPAAAEPEKEPTQDTDSSEAVVDAVIDQAVSKKKDDKLTEEDIRQQEAIEKLVADKTYFVPVGQVKRRHRRMALLTVFIIALVLAGLFVYGVQSGRINLDNLPQF